MIGNKTVTVVLPAYNASKTLEKTYKEIPFHIVDHIILVDDHSSDDTIEVARNLGIDHIISHNKIGDMEVIKRHVMIKRSVYNRTL